MPNLSNGKLLKTVMLSPEAFGELAEDLGDGLGANVRRKIFSRISEARKVSHDEWLANRVFGKRLRNKYNGFAQQSLKVVHDCMLYFVNKMGGTYKTQMNKLLFYTDFISYRTYGMGITGLSYLAMQYGPVPCNWDRVYSAFDDIRPELVASPNGNVGERLTSNAVCDESVFTQERLAILNAVCSAFGTMSSRQISKHGHAEPAWLANVGKHSPIDYTHAFCMNVPPGVQI